MASKRALAIKFALDTRVWNGVLYTTIAKLASNFSLNSQIPILQICIGLLHVAINFRVGCIWAQTQCTSKHVSSISTYLIGEHWTEVHNCHTQSLRKRLAHQECAGARPC